MQAIKGQIKHRLSVNRQEILYTYIIQDKKNTGATRLTRELFTNPARDASVHWQPVGSATSPPEKRATIGNRAPRFTSGHHLPSLLEAGGSSARPRARTGRFSALRVTNPQTASHVPIVM